MGDYSIKASDLKRRDSELGRGQNGVVYAASYHGQEVAAKVIDLRSVPKGDRPGVVDAFNREMAILVSLHSPRVLVVHGAVQEPNRLTLVTEFAANGTVPLTIFLSLFQGSYFEAKVSQAFQDGIADFRWTRGAAVLCIPIRLHCNCITTALQLQTTHCKL